MNLLAALLSVALHTLAAGLILYTAPLHPAPPPPPTARETSQEMDIVFVGTAEAGAGHCESSYLGIGVRTSAVGRVWDVAPGSPAQQAMIFEGDTLLNPDILWPNSLPEGYIIALEVRRGEIVTTKRLKIARICYS